MAPLLRTASVLLCLAPAGSAQCSLTTLFAANNGGSVGGAVYFDINVASAIRVTAVEVNTSTAIGSSIGGRLFTRPGTWVGAVASPGWAQVGVDDGTGVSAGNNAPSLLTLQTPFVLTPGLHAIAIVAGGGVGGAFNHRYTNFAGPQNFGNALYTLTLGGATNVPFTGTVFSTRVWNGTIRCTSARGIFADFSASPTSGPSPLTVNFADQTYTSDPGGVLQYEWDLDNDGVVDSNARNPVFTYGSCGSYTVTLTATDAQNGSSTRMRGDYILVDPFRIPVAGFLGSPTTGSCPLTVSFTDTSINTPTQWDWDLDGDGVVDSNAQHPTFTYTRPGCYTVSLMVSNPCGSNTLTRTNYVCCVDNDDCTSATSVVNGVNGPFSNRGSSTSSPWPCALGGNDVWFHWVADCGGSVTFETCGPRTNYDTSLEVFDGPCNALVSLGCNDDSCGLQSRVTVNVVAGADYHVRVGGFNGAQGEFDLTIRSGATGLVTYGNNACVGAAGVPALKGIGEPSLGSRCFGLRTTNATPGTFVVDVISVAPTPPIAIGLCGDVLVDPSLAILVPLVADPAGAAELPLPIPLQPALVGGSVYCQAAVFDGTIPAQIALTDGLQVTIGATSACCGPRLAALQSDLPLSPAFLARVNGSAMTPAFLAWFGAQGWMPDFAQGRELVYRNLPLQNAAIPVLQGPTLVGYYMFTLHPGENEAAEFVDLRNLSNQILITDHTGLNGIVIHTALQGNQVALLAAAPVGAGGYWRCVADCADKALRCSGVLQLLCGATCGACLGAPNPIACGGCLGCLGGIGLACWWDC